MAGWAGGLSCLRAHELYATLTRSPSAGVQLQVAPGVDSDGRTKRWVVRLGRLVLMQRKSSGGSEGHQGASASGIDAWNRALAPDKKRSGSIVTNVLSRVFPPQAQCKKCAS